jgi:hypothetical protein
MAVQVAVTMTVTVALNVAMSVAVNTSNSKFESNQFGKVVNLTS